MSIVESELALLRDPRLAAIATSAWPAWLWSVDASRMLWANAVGAALFGAANTTQCTQRRFDAKDASAAQISRLAATLPSVGQERLERLRGFGAGFGRALTCACSRMVLADGTAAILIAATEQAGPALTLGERVRRLFVDGARLCAAFAPDGTLLHASAACSSQLGAATTLAALGIEGIAAAALETGSASGAVRFGEASLAATIARLGKDASRVLLLTLTPQPSAPASAAPLPAAAMPEAAIEAPPPPAPPALPPVPASSTAAQPPPAPRASAPDPPAMERRHPLRFVWQMDADGRFVVGSDEFIALVGPRTMAAFGRLWDEVAAELKLDPANQVARAVATRETWSGVTISWPVDELSERLPVELSGLPVFDRDRTFRGYRGFGVCRDIDRINQLARARRERPLGFMPAPEAPPPPAERVAAAGTPDEHPAPSLASASAVAPASANVVPFRPGPPAEPKVPTLSPVERKAFGELAQELTARLRGPQQAAAAPETAEDDFPAERRAAAAEVAEPAGAAKPAARAEAAALPAEAHSEPADVGSGAEGATATSRPLPIEQVLLDRIPIGVLVYRHDSLLHANRHFLEWSGYQSLEALAAAGGLNTLFAEPGAEALADSGGARTLSITTPGGDRLPVEGRLFTVPWNGETAFALILTSGQAEELQRAAALALGAAEGEIRELKSILDAGTDGVIVLDRDGRIVSADGGAEALFGRAAGELAGRALGELFAPESERAVLDYFDRVARATTARHDPLDVAAPGHEGRLTALAMTIARIGGERFCAVFRDATARKKIEEEFRAAKRETQKAAAVKAEFLAKVSHEIRTPLNAITGFAEVIIAERFGPIGNERYREYLKDIHGAGAHLVSLLNDLLDLSKIETGQLDLSFANVNLNDLTQQCVAIMQPQANRARIIIRTSLTPGLPQVVADERSLRQIVLNLLSNSIRFTGPGGQVIVSTVFSDTSEAVLRVRDTGVGMSEKDIAAALEPFRQAATSGSWGSGGTGLGLPLTKALAEANRANFSIKSAPNAGTLVEVAFPPTRVQAS